MSVNAGAETDYYAASAAKAVMQYLPLAYANGGDLKAREEMGIAAHFGGIAFNKAGLGYVHAIAHQLGAHYGVPHGRANAIVLPYILTVNRHASEKRLAILAKKIGIIDPTTNNNDSDLAEYLIAKVADLLDTVNIDPIVQGMQTHDFDHIAKAVAKEVSDTYAVPTYLSSAAIKEILMRIKTVSDQKIDQKTAD